MANPVRIEFEQQGDECMRDAIRMANVYMNSTNVESFNSTLDGFFEIDRQTVAKQVALVRFKYVRHEDCYVDGDDDDDDDVERWAETDPEPGLENVTIYISDFFPRRIERAGLSRTDKEYRILIFDMNVSILHETAHLMNRWAGHKDSPELHQCEAGFFLERRMFGNVLKLGYRPNKQDPAAREVVAIVIEDRGNVYQVSQNWIDFLFDYVFNGVPMPIAKRIEVPAVHVMDPSIREGLKFRSVENTSKTCRASNSNTPISTISRCNRNKMKNYNKQ